MQSRPSLKTLLVIFVFVRSVSSVRVKRDDHRMDMLDVSPGKRTFILGKMLLIPTLAAVGMKFLALLPIFLAKIALLGIMNFVSTNLNLALTTVLNLKNFFKKKKSIWPFQEDTVLPTNFEFATPLNPSLRYEYLLNRRSIKPESKGSKQLGLSDNQDNFGDKYRTFRNSFTEFKPSPINNGNIGNLPYRRQYPSIQSGGYRCFWTDSSEERLLRKEFDTNFYVKKQYHVKKPKDSDKSASIDVTVVEGATESSNDVGY